MLNRRTFLNTVPAAVLAIRSVVFSESLQAQQGTPAYMAPGGQMAGSPEGVILPGQKWKAHDRSRPQARKVIPGLPLPQERAASDATVLFDGKDLSQWSSRGRDGQLSEPKWKIDSDFMEMVPRSGSLVTKEKFGDCQLHLEWMTPTGTDPSRRGQMRGNSGVILMGHYEIQILSSFDNITYADGAAGGIYGLYPPLVNPCRPEGEWNTYDIVFRAPVFKGQDVAKPGFLTLFFNGLLAHDHVELLGSTDVLPLAKYQPHGAEEPFTLQGHAGPVRYRNIWIRRLQGYDS